MYCLLSTPRAVDIAGFNITGVSGKTVHTYLCTYIEGSGRGSIADRPHCLSYGALFLGYSLVLVVATTYVAIEKSFQMDRRRSSIYHLHNAGNRSGQLCPLF